MLSQGEMPRVGDRAAPVGSPAGGRADIGIALFGTSLARRAEWPGRIAGRPSPCGRGVIDVTVWGRPGAGSRHGMAVAGQGFRAHHDVVILEYAINDADLFDGISRAESTANHRSMIAAIRNANPDAAIILMATNPVRGLQWLQRPFLAGYYRDYARLADEMNVSFFDGTARWRIAGTDRRNLPDGLHPDPAAEAALYHDGLLTMITRITEPSCRTLRS